jgi:hypothetical protein
MRYRCVREQQPTQPPYQPQDPWAVWFSRFVQIIGIAIVLEEILLHDPIRATAIVTGLALTSGVLGIERVIQWWTRK